MESHPEADVTTPNEMTSPDWPRRLHDALAEQAAALRDRTARFLADNRDAAYATDAARLEKAGADLVAMTDALLDPASRTADVPPPEAVRRTRHDLMNVLNRLLGYSQLLLEAEDDEALPPDQQRASQAVYDLAKDCERVILAHLAKPKPAEAVEIDAPPSHGPSAITLTVPDPCVILIIDDDEHGRGAVARALRAQGHALVEAESGLRGVELLESQSFDLVLLDINMPGMNGYEVLRIIRSDPRRDAMPVLMVSGLDEIQHTVRCIESGAEDFLPKPVDHVLLRARINALLARRQMRVRELEQFFPPEVARQLIARPELLMRGEAREITVLFCDIRGYSRISRRLGAALTIEWVSAVMEQLSECVLSNRGVVVDFIGDEMLAMWGALGDQPDQAEWAARTALAMFGRLPGLNEEWQERLKEPMDFGVGINTGVAWVGNSGTRRKFKYGPSGDTVNVASRVQGATKYLKAPVIVTKETHDGLGGKFLSRRLSKVKVVNINDPVELYQIVPEGTPDWTELKSRYEEALGLYEAGNCAEAARRLGGLIAEHGAQGPPLGLMARCIEGLMVPEKWSPVFELAGK